MLVVFLSIFVADTKVIFDYNFVATVSLKGNKQLVRLTYLPAINYCHKQLHLRYGMVSGTAYD